jgi:hypothetical protein
MEQSTTQENLDAWARWAKQFDFTTEYDDDLTDAYHRAMERIALASGPARPSNRVG